MAVLREMAPSKREVSSSGSRGAGKVSNGFARGTASDDGDDESEVLVEGKLAYASQEPWIQSGTLRDNILFGKPMDKSRWVFFLFCLYFFFH